MLKNIAQDSNYLHALTALTKSNKNITFGVLAFKRWGLKFSLDRKEYIIHLPRKCHEKLEADLSARSTYADQSDQCAYLHQTYLILTKSKLAISHIFLYEVPVNFIERRETW